MLEDIDQVLSILLGNLQHAVSSNKRSFDHSQSGHSFDPGDSEEATTCRGPTERKFAMQQV